MIMKINITGKLLRNIIHGPFSSWIEASALGEKPDDLNDAYTALLRYHREETAYLINLCRALAEEIRYGKNV